jgi:hypothetical protein
MQMSTETSAKIGSKPDFLMEEYKICHDYASNMNATSWQMAAVLMPISVASLAYLLSLPGPRSAARLIVAVLIATMAIGILWTWLMLFRRWFAYQQIAYHRMAEIERELGLWLITYGQVLRSGSEISSQVGQEIENDEHYLRLRRRFGKLPRGKTTTSVTFMTWLLIIGWLLFVIIELVGTLLNI